MRQYEEHDLLVINDWFRVRGHREMDADEVPRIGLVEPGVAAGFLYMTDSNLAFLENFVSNPDAPAREVSRAMDQIIEGLVEVAVDAGITKCFVFSKKRSTIKKAENAGFNRQGTWEMLSMEVH